MNHSFALGDTLLAGATGLVGREVTRLWRGPGALHLLLRRPLAGVAHPSLVVDFQKLPPLPNADVAICGLGTTIGQAGSQAAFRAVDFDAVLAFARAAQAAGVRRFALVSALGAKATSSNFYARVKGEVEAAVIALRFESLVLVRPSLLLGDRASLGQPRRSGEGIAGLLGRPLAPFIPKAWRPIEATTVARAMLRALAQAQPGVRVLSSGEMQTLGA